VEFPLARVLRTTGRGRRERMGRSLLCAGQRRPPAAACLTARRAQGAARPAQRRSLSRPRPDWDVPAAAAAAAEAALVARRASSAEAAATAPDHAVDTPPTPGTATTAYNIVFVTSEARACLARASQDPARGPRGGVRAAGADAVPPAPRRTSGRRAGASDSVCPPWCPGLLQRSWCSQSPQAYPVAAAPPEPAPAWTPKSPGADMRAP